MNERIKFIAAYLEDDDETFTELCARFSVSRKTGYKWVERYEASGVTALEERSRAPLSHPRAVAPEVVDAVVAARRTHPRWGPRKLLVVMKRRRPDFDLPAASTVGEILRRKGLIGKRRRIRRSSPYGDRLREYEAPNAVWCADFKGSFAIGGRDGRRCNPLTITDGYSRMLLRCVALERTLSANVERVFESVFRDYGLPLAIRTDNGPPFSTLAPGGLSRLAIWWIRLGIRPERIQPGRPDQNGRHERMHGTLKVESCKPPRSSFRAQQRAFDAFLDEYNHVRPHEALDQQTPASFYKLSPRRYPRVLPEVEYPGHLRVLRTYSNGVISFKGSQWYLSGCLTSELVGLEEIDDDRWKVYFGPVALGVLDIRNAKQRGPRQFGLLVRTDGEINRRRRGRPRRT